MTLVIIFLLSTIIVFLIFLLIWQGRKTGREGGTAELLLSMQGQMDGLRRQLFDSLAEASRSFRDINKALMEQISSTRTAMDQKLDATTKTMDHKLEETTRAMMDVHKQLGAVDEAVKRVFDVGKDIASLQEILSAPKLRGGMGELFLEDLLAQIMPSSYYELQHTFRSGEKVDAVIKAGEKIVPIDAKFPLENFRRMASETESSQQERYRKDFLKDIRKHIENISSKYILPDEGTYDFALMYIPAENVYYETIIRSAEPGSEKGVFEYSISRRVIPVSPNSFYAYLQVILLGLRGMEIEVKAKEILTKISGLRTQLNKSLEDFRVLGKHISNSQKSFDEAQKKFDKLDYAISSLLELSDSDQKRLDPDQ
ncbi:MAG: DNA recombination protein RmuC [Acidobacteriota bacterium]